MRDQAAWNQFMAALEDRGGPGVETFMKIWAVATEATPDLAHPTITWVRDVMRVVWNPGTRCFELEIAADGALLWSYFDDGTLAHDGSSDFEDELPPSAYEYLRLFKHGDGE